MLSRAIEYLASTPARARLFARLLVATTVMMVGVGAVHFFGGRPLGGGATIVDFDCFYLAGRLALAGRIEEAYRFADFAAVQRAFSGAKNSLPWTYPPQFDLVAAGLALLPRGLAYLLFTGGTLAAYLIVLRRLAAGQFVTVLALVYVPVLVTISCGQNGLLTGALVGAVCLGLLAGRTAAGLPLGLMVIKPHLAVALGLYVLADRRWGVAITAAAVMAISSALATLLLGPAVWRAMLGATAEAAGFLANGQYALFRMTSAYAALRSLGLPAGLAMTAQVVAALLALTATWRARERLAPREAIGVAVIATLLVSPYAYDYDLPILGIALALLLPTLLAYGTAGERSAIYGLVIVASGIGIAQTLRLTMESRSDADVGTLAGVLMVALLALVWRVVSRAARPAEPLPRSPAGRTAY